MQSNPGTADAAAAAEAAMQSLLEVGHHHACPANTHAGREFKWLCAILLLLMRLVVCHAWCCQRCE